MTKHLCTTEDSHRMICEEDTCGEFIFYIDRNDYYSKWCYVNYCPLCGKKANENYSVQTYVSNEEKKGPLDKK